MMTLGFLLVFFGIQLNVVDSFVLTPRMTTFMSDQFSENSPVANSSPAIIPNQLGTNNQAPYSQVAYSASTAASPTPIALGPNRVIRPPGWIGWPIMFLGAVFFLNGVAIRK
jgi:hypothetical protein